MAGDENRPRFKPFAFGKRRRIEKIGELGDDLLVEILIRLPSHRYVSRCKPVCKRWRSLISSPRFNRRFVSQWRINQPPMPDNPSDLRSIIVSFLPPMPLAVADKFRVLDCFKDLVLCGSWDLDSDNKEPCRSYLVCNPFTKQWVALPLAPQRPMGYQAQVTKFVCEPRISYDLDLEEEEPNASVVYSEYRFRVVTMYLHGKSTKLDLFCSESREWTKEALVLYRRKKFQGTETSCNGELFWHHSEFQDSDARRVIPSLAVFNPFRPDVPPIAIDAFSYFGLKWGTTSASQGALHFILMGDNHEFVVWRLDQDRKSWSKQHQGLLKTSRCGKFEPQFCFLPFMHPHKPEMIFFHYFVNGPDHRSLLSFDLRTGELEFFVKFDGGPPIRMVFQPTVSCLPTPIPRYEELQRMYDGSYSFWVQSSNTSTTLSMTGNQNRALKFKSLRLYASRPKLSKFSCGSSRRTKSGKSDNDG